MTKLVVFCDGTWNHPKIPEPTSVQELSEAVVNAPARGQKVKYFEGIGTAEEFDSPTRAVLRKYIGGIFGRGLDGKVKEAYQWICQTYQPGDEIYLFGFSRGAFTARSVAGMIRKCGIVEDHSPAGINAAFQLYRKPGERNHPDKPHIREERRAMSPGFATSQSDLDWRKDGSELVHIAYLGVFDTVGARGIPPALFGPLATLWNLQYRFHDAALSSLVKSARHAIAVDERRVFYRPTRWANLPRLNAGFEADDALRPYQQRWFIGNHGVIGGSVEDAEPLSVIVLNWVLLGAGLALEPGMAPDMSKANALAQTGAIDHRRKWLNKWRKGPEGQDSVDPSVQERMQADSDYRPGSLPQQIKDWFGG